MFVNSAENHCEYDGTGVAALLACVGSATASDNTSADDARRGVLSCKSFTTNQLSRINRMSDRTFTVDHTGEAAAGVGGVAG